jgi:transcriptional regulator with XRE-family HTH domain
MPATSPPLQENAAASLAELGAQLRTRRRKLKVTSTATAEAAGISRVTLHRIEKGEPSVTAGAYAAAALALGLHVLVALEQPAPPAADRRGWIPARIPLNQYPRLRELAWQVHGTDELSPGEALGIYERNWRHIDAGALSQEEKDLIDALRAALGPGDAV